MSTCNQPLPSLTTRGNEVLSISNTNSINNRNKEKHSSNQHTTLVSTCPAAANLRSASLFSLPAVVTNSALVRQRASIKDQLAAATVSTGAALPMMIGGRGGRFVSNVAEESNELAGIVQNQLQINGPKNTALRAEQRKQNMVSVVRPVMAAEVRQDNTSEYKLHSRGKLEDSSLWSNLAANNLSSKKSILDEMMIQEQRLGDTSSIDYEFMQLGKFNVYHQQNEQQARQQMALMRREEVELNRTVRRQHRFFLAKLEDRKRQLKIVQAVWTRRDLKQAIEKMLDLYQQGLVFSCNNSQQRNQSNLNSLNSPLFVDILGVLLMRPKLWNLEICQLLLPVLVSDLLVSNHENYTELAIKALKMVLTNFSSLIKRTLDEREQVKPLGVDLNLEDRLNRAANCYRLLLTARKTLSSRSSWMQSSKLSTASRELEQLLTTFESGSGCQVN